MDQFPWLLQAVVEEVRGENAVAIEDSEENRQDPLSFGW